MTTEAQLPKSLKIQNPPKLPVFSLLQPSKMAFLLNSLKNPSKSGSTNNVDMVKKDQFDVSEGVSDIYQI